MKKETIHTDTAPDREISDMLERLEQDYHSIPVPPEMKQRILKTFEEAETMTTNNTDNTNTDKKIRSLFPRRAAQTAAAALLAVTVLANSGPQVAFAMEQIPVIGAITKVVTFRTYERTEGRTEAKVEVPQLDPSQAGAPDAAAKLNRSVEEYTSQIISRFEADTKAAGADAPHGLFSDYQVITDNDRFFTLRLNTTEIMASGNESVKIYTIDKKADKILTLADLFPGDSDYNKHLTAAVKEQMRNNMKADSSLTYFLEDDALGFSSLKEDQSFYINDKGNLVLVFNEYDVAPGYMGLVEIELPESVYHMN